MRKISVSVLAGIIILAGCSKNSDTPASIVGTWQLNQLVIKTYINNTLQASDTTSSGSISFESNGSVTEVDDDSTTNGSYTYDASAKALTLITGVDTIRANVTVLTSNNLHFNAALNEELAGNTITNTVDADYKR